MSPEDREKRREERNREIVERMFKRRPFSAIMKDFKALQKKASEK